MLEAREVPRPHDPLETSLSAADDRIRLSSWLPPQDGVVPRIRWGSRWINVLWAIPLVVALLVLGIAIAQAGQGGYNEDHEFYGYRMPI